MTLFLEPRRYIAIQAAVELVSNGVLNAAFGWYWTENLERVPLWGWASVATDLVATGFGIGFVLSLLFTWRLHQRLRRGKTKPARDYPGALPLFVPRLPFHPLLRSAAIAFTGVIAALLLVLLIQLSGSDSLTPQNFIVIKTAFAAVMAFATMMATGYRALGDGVTPERPKGYWPA